MSVGALVETYNNSLPAGWERQKIFERNTGNVEERIVHEKSIYQNESRDWVVAKNLVLIAISQYAFAFESARYLFEGGKFGAQKLSETWDTYKLSKEGDDFNLKTFAKNQVADFTPAAKTLLQGGMYGLAALVCYYDPQITGYEYYFGTATLAMTAYAVFGSMGFRLQAQKVFEREIPKLDDEKVQKLSFVDTVGAFFQGSMSITHFLKMEPIAYIDGENYMVEESKPEAKKLPKALVMESYIPEVQSYILEEVPKTDEEKKED